MIHSFRKKIGSELFNMELRLLLAVILSFFVFVAWGAYTSKKEAEYRKSAHIEEGAQNKSAELSDSLEKKPLAKKQKTPREETPVFSNPDIIKSVEQKDILIDTDLYIITLTNVGASFKNIQLKKYLDKDKQPLDLVPQTDDFLKPPYLSANNSQITDALNYSHYDVEATPVLLSEMNPQKTISFTLKTPSGLEIKKDFTFYHNRYQIDLNVAITDPGGNLSDQKYFVNWGPGFGNEKPNAKGKRYAFIGPISYSNNKAKKHDSKDLKEDVFLSENLSWVCLQNKYFTSALIPKNGIDTGKISQNTDNKMSVGLQLINDNSQSIHGEMLIFAGPKEENRLRSYKVHLENTIDYGWFGNTFSFLVNPLLKGLRFFYRFTHNYGFSIIIVTILVKILFFPLTQKSLKSMKGMQKVQPYIKIIQERYKDDKAQLNKEMMRIYKEHKINPLGGCLPMILQIPVFISLYNVLLVSIDLRGAPFIFWIQDLSEKDPYYITPVLMGISMLIQQKMTPTTGDPTQAKIMMFLPLVFTFMFLNFPTGLVIYWLVNNVLSIGQQYYLNKSGTAK